MKKQSTLAYIMVTLVALLASHSVSATRIQCPTTIKTNQSLQNKINGWDAFLEPWKKSAHHFNQVTFYSGPPNQQASLAPDNEHTKGNKLIWTFQQGDAIWLACGYSNTDIQLIRKLPITITSCTASYQSKLSKLLIVDCI